MAIELFANNAASTLDGGINDSVTSLDVADASDFPSSGNFRILIDSEILLVTAVSTNTFTVARGQEGTSAASHSNGAAVTHVITRDALYQFRQDSVSRGADSSRPSSQSEGEGRLYIPTDDLAIHYDDGSAWRQHGPIFPLTPPTASDFTWVNQGSATATQFKGGVVLDVGVSATTNWRGLVKSVTAPYDIKIGFLPSILPTSGSSLAALAGRQSSDGKLVTFHFAYSSSYFLQINKYSGPTAYNSTYTLQIGGTTALPPPNLNVIWMRIKDDNTNREFYWSINGRNWVLMHQVGRTDYLTVDQVGFMFDQETTAYGGIMRVIHYEE